MLVPLQHDKMAARRFPIITVGLIVLNVIIFLGTHWSQESDAPKLREARTHILLLAATHPELTVPSAAEKLVATFKSENPDVWQQISNPNRDLVDGWDAKMRLEEKQEVLQAEMDALCADYEKIQSTSVNTQFAFVPASPKPWAYVTANFLHGGWLHLIGNMWFLWLAGFVLEDAWGRGVYTAFYFVAGAAALQFHLWTNPQSMIPTLGASGAVAALMGAFLVRFPTMKIEMGWLRLNLIGLFSGKMWYRFKAPAYTLLPLWLLLEVFSGALSGSKGGVAHWAHVGGFAFGAVVALCMKVSGVEQKLNAKVEEHVSWTSDPAISDATEALHEDRIDDVIAKLEPYLKSKPNEVEGWLLLREAKWRKQDTDGYLEGTARMCELYLKAREYDSAWQSFGEFSNVAGEKKLPARIWYDLGQGLEQQQNFDVALDQYKAIVKAYPADIVSVQAQMAAGKLCLNKLNRPVEAVQWYESAATSQAPHPALESAIQFGLAAARKASGQPEPLKAMAAVAMGASIASVLPKTAVAIVKPLSWGELDAPPVWGHGANGDTVYKPDFSHELTATAKK
jgi:membrane associated rhomboid family serine protease